MRKIILIMTLLSMAWAAFAGTIEKNIEEEWWCKTTPWTLNRDLGIGAIIGSIQQADRLETLQMIWYEVVSHPAKTIAPPLIAYLSKTESNPELRAFINAHTFFAFERFSTDPLIRKWPERPAYSEQKTELRQLCEHFRRAGGERMLEGRGPQSTETNKQKSPAGGGQL